MALAITVVAACSSEASPGPLPVEPPSSDPTDRTTDSHVLEWFPPGEPLCTEDFTRFGSWAAFMEGHACSYANLSHMTSWGRRNVDVSARGLMYRFRAGPDRCTDQRVGEATIPIPDAREVWLEFSIEFSDNYSPVNPNCPGKGGYKLLLPWLSAQSVPCGDRRFNLIVWEDRGYEATVPGFPQCDEIQVRPDGGVETARSLLAGPPGPGETHTYRVYFGVLGGGEYGVYVDVDGVVTHSYVTRSIPDAGYVIDRVMLGSNRNSWPEEDVFLWWKDVTVWSR